MRPEQLREVMMGMNRAFGVHVAEEFSDEEKRVRREALMSLRGMPIEARRAEIKEELQEIEENKEHNFQYFKDNAREVPGWEELDNKLKLFDDKVRCLDRIHNMEEDVASNSKKNPELAKEYQELAKKLEEMYTRYTELEDAVKDDPENENAKAELEKLAPELKTFAQTVQSAGDELGILDLEQEKLALDDINEKLGPDAELDAYAKQEELILSARDLATKALNDHADHLNETLKNLDSLERMNTMLASPAVLSANNKVDGAQFVKDAYTDYMHNHSSIGRFFKFLPWTSAAKDYKDYMTVRDRYMEITNGTVTDQELNDYVFHNTLSGSFQGANNPLEDDALDEGNHNIENLYKEENKINYPINENELEENNLEHVNSINDDMEERLPEDNINKVNEI